MPRSSIVIAPSPVDADAVVHAAGEVRTRFADLGPDDLLLRPLDGSAVLQVLTGPDVLLSVLRPRLLPRLDEVRRLRPDIDTAALAVPSFWTEAYTSFSAAGLVGIAILDAVAASLSGVAHHDALPA